MRIIRPLTITDAMLTDCNVPETDGTAGEWGVAVPYLVGDTVRVTTTGVHKIYEALENVTGGDSPEIDVLNAVPKWLEISATNRWKAFDQKVGSQTSQAVSIVYEITPGAIVDSIAFLNMDCETINIVSTDPVEGEVYNETIEMITTVVAGEYLVYDWYSYYFSEYFVLTDAVKVDLPPYFNAVLTITISYNDSTAKCGGLVLGIETNIGETQYSPTVGIHDYSIKEQDTWGVWSVAERAFSRRLTAEIAIPNLSIAYVLNLLATYRATPIVWIGSVDNINYSALIAYGFYKDFSIIISYPDYAICSLDIESLT